jgi:hypothetical protein
MASLDSASGRPKKKEAAATRVATASKGLVSRSGFNFGSAGIRSGLPVEFNLSFGHFGKHGHPVLNTQTLDLPMPQLPAIPDKLTPCRRQPFVAWTAPILCRTPVRVNHKSSR